MPRKSGIPKTSAKAGAKAGPGAKTKPATSQSASRQIEERIRALGDWRGETLAEVRRLIHKADP